MWETLRTVVFQACELGNMVHVSGLVFEVRGSCANQLS